jgi:hypothetical protein
MKNNSSGENSDEMIKKYKIISEELNNFINKIKDNLDFNIDKIEKTDLLEEVIKNI